MIVNFIVDSKLTVEKSIIALKLVLSEEVKSTWRPGMNVRLEKNYCLTKRGGGYIIEYTLPSPSSQRCPAPEIIMSVELNTERCDCRGKAGR